LITIVVTGAECAIQFPRTSPTAASCNETEQTPMARALERALNRRRDLRSEKFVRDLDRPMLGDLWRWAGGSGRASAISGFPSRGFPFRCAS